MNIRWLTNEHTLAGVCVCSSDSRDLVALLSPEGGYGDKRGSPRGEKGCKIGLRGGGCMSDAWSAYSEDNEYRRCSHVYDDRRVVRCGQFRVRGTELCVAHTPGFISSRRPRVVSDGPWAGLSVRVANALRRAGIRDPERLADYTDEELLRRRSIGVGALTTLRQWQQATGR